VIFPSHGVKVTGYLNESVISSSLIKVLTLTEEFAFDLGSLLWGELTVPFY